MKKELSAYAKTRGIDIVWKKPKSIDTVAGKAFFVKTEVEDESGRWNDDYWTKDGYWVIHRGKEHDVYKLRKVI